MPNISLEHFVCCERHDVSCSHSNRDLFTCEDNMLFSHVKISCFRAKAHLVFHWYLYNKTALLDNKAVIYSQSGAVHAKSFYLQDQNEDEVRILTDNQDCDDIHLFVPNLKKFDGFGGRKRSEIMVTSVDQTISGNKFFQNIKASNPTDDDVANKNYVDF